MVESEMRGHARAANAMRAFADATADSSHLLATIARRGAEDLNACAMVVVAATEHAPAARAMYDADSGALRGDPLGSLQLLDLDPIVRRVQETGEPYFAPSLELERVGSTAYFDHLRRLGMRSLLVVAVRARDCTLGQLVIARHRPDAGPFDPRDLESAQHLADCAALALSNAQLLADGRREHDDRTRVADHFRILAEASREFAAATDDYHRLLDLVACRLGQLVGDICGIRAVTADGAWLEPTGGAYHRDPELLAALRESMALPQRVGEGVSGKVAATGKAIITPRITPAEFAASSEPKYRAFLERLGVTSAITLPLVCRGKVVGIANLMRTQPVQPYGERDLHIIQSVADHAAQAIGNARAYAAERAARDAAEHATTALAKAEARFARLSESGILGIVVLEIAGPVIDINDALLEIVGYSRDELVSGRVAWRDLTPPGWDEVDARARDQLVTSGVGRLREKEYLRKDGRRVPVLTGSAMIEGEPPTCISFVLDLSERKQAAAVIEQLREQRSADAKFRALLETAPDAMVIAGSDGAIILVNGQAETLFGYARAEMIGQPVELLIPARLRDAHPAHRATYFERPEIRSMGLGLELAGRHKDGHEFPIEVSLSPLETEHGTLVSSAIRDMTARKRADLQRARLAAIVDASDDAIIGKDLDGTVTSWNRGAEWLFGYTADEIVGRSIVMLVPPGREHEEAEILETLAQGGSRQFDTVRRRKDQRDIDVSVTISPVRDSAGRVIAISKVARDITERKHAEVELAAAKDRAVAASRELETFSYSVAHDLRAPLRGMNGFAQVLLDDYADKLDADGRDCLEEIRTNARKMGDLIDALLSLSRVTRGDWRPERIDLSAIARTVAAELGRADPARDVRVVIADGIEAEADPRLARALLDNLLGNAWKFTAKVPTARIEFGATVEADARTLFVRDNGAGFDMAHAANLFAPFQRLHTVGEFAGTGIGLATVQRIVHRHGGRIWAEANVNAGAVFHFTLPPRED